MRAGPLIGIALLPALAGCATMGAGNVAAPVAAATPPPAATPPAAFQFLYGSAEAAALSEQAYNGVVDQARRIAADRTGARASAVLAPDATLAQPTALACDRALPMAAVFDMDETAVLNLGYEHGDALSGRGFDPARWARFEKTGSEALVAVPGAVRAFAELRRLGISVIINTNRNADAAAETEHALAFAQLGSFRHGDTLFLRGDGDGKSGKDGRRAAIAKRYCVVLMGGDQLSDFSDLFTGAPGARRAAVQSAAVQAMFGRTWFVLPNPVYGTGLAGNWDEVFPTDRRWSDPAPIERAQGVK